MMWRIDRKKDSYVRVALVVVYRKYHHVGTLDGGVGGKAVEERN